jgi:hypothetical protein
MRCRGLGHEAEDDDEAPQKGCGMDVMACGLRLCDGVVVASESRGDEL